MDTRVKCNSCGNIYYMEDMIQGYCQDCFITKKDEKIKELEIENEKLKEINKNLARLAARLANKIAKKKR